LNCVLPALRAEIPDANSGSPMTVIDQRIVGTWRLKSTRGRDDAGNELDPPYGPVAMGLVVFQPDERMMAVLCDGRKALPGGEPRQFMSYAGVMQHQELAWERVA
jgi:hypothetical protein